MKIIQKHQFKQIAAFAGLYFLAIGLGVLLGNLVDHQGNMFYAPAFSALVGGGIYQVFVEKIQRTGAILVVALVIGAFVGGLLAELVASRGHYQSKLGNAVSFLLFSFTTTGPILMMWFQPASYRASLLARGKSMDYIERVMVPSNMGTVSWFLLTLLLGALLGYLLGYLVCQKLNRK